MYYCTVYVSKDAIQEGHFTEKIKSFKLVPEVSLSYFLYLVRWHTFKTLIREPVNCSMALLKRL